MPLTLGVLSLSCAWSQQYTINTYAGNRTAGFAGDSGAPTSAELSLPLGLAFDSSGNLYIADSVNQRIRKISGGTITTVAGNGTGGYSGDMAAATSAELLSPSAVARGFLRQSLYRGHRQPRHSHGLNLRGVAPSHHSRATTPAAIAAMAASGFDAELDFPTSVAVDSSGNVYIADSGNNVIREVSPAAIINTIVGGAATSQQL